jgi:MFS transporter, MHS family, proline/betaine transporter
MNSANIRRVIAAGMIGNVLEWYDFAIYGYFAAQIGRYFFPHEDAVAQLLSAFGVFAIGYLMRPIGGMIVGHIGDSFGRRAALTFSVAAMAIPTFLIGLLPGYQTIGLLAPIGLTVLRIVQGLSVGGEYTSSMVFLVEHAREGRRGLMGALAASGSAVGMLLGSAVGAAFAAPACQPQHSTPGAGAFRSCWGSWSELQATSFAATPSRQEWRRSARALP